MYSIWLKRYLKTFSLEVCQEKKINQACAAKVLVFYSSVELFLSKWFGLLLTIYLSTLGIVSILEEELLPAFEWSHRKW